MTFRKIRFWIERTFTLRHQYALHPPRIVSHPDWLGGKPRLAGTRLSLAWFAANRHMPRAWFAESWPYLTDEHLALALGSVEQIAEELRDDA